MSVFGKAGGIGLTYLTAIMTLFAGLPHFECRCPNGHTKLFCLGSASPDKASSCCRDHDATSGGPAKQRPCCGHGNGGPRAQAPLGRAHLQAAGCLKVLVHAEDIAISSGKTMPREITVVPGDLAFSLPPTLLALRMEAQRQIAGPFHLLSPPIDLAVRLQRLLI
jgi:hypothetical protein